MTTTLNRNGQGRPSLAQQIDRLDAILDGLAGALNEAVAQAVKEAVAVAVQAAVAETLANPELRRRIVPQAEKPSLLRRLLAKARGAAVAVKAQACRLGRWVARTVSGGVKAVKTGVCFGWTATTAKVTAVIRSVPTWPLLMWKLRTPVLLALGVGGTLAVACYCAGPLVASAVSGVAGMTEVLKGKARRLHEQFAIETTGAAQW
jgi:hypothetical protein